MKYTRATFLLALALLMVATALPQRAEPEMIDTPLDLTDVQEVRVVGENAAAVRFSHDPSIVSWPSAGDGVVTTRREGDVLVIESTLRRAYPGIMVRLPPKVRRLDMGNGAVTAEAPVPSLHLTVGGELQWTGDAGRLEIVDTGVEVCDEEEPEASWCTGTIRVSAEADELVVTSLDSLVQIDSPAAIGQVTLRLAPRATFNLNNARSLANVRIVAIDVDAEGQPPAEAAIAVSDGRAPTEEAAAESESRTP